MEKFTIFGRPGCGFCVNAKKICELKGLAYRYVDIWEEGITKEDLAKTIGKEVNTVPQVFHGKQHIGGYDDLKAYLENLLDS